MKISVNLFLFCFLHYITIHTMQPNNIKPKKNNQQEQHTIILDYPWEQKNGIWLNDSPSKYYTFPDKSHPKNIISNTQSKAHNQSKK